MSSMKFLRRMLFGILLCFSTSVAAHDRQPFLHEFGELRVYFSDWLVVCDDWGNGSCRAVYYVLGDDDTTFFGESVLRLHQASAGGPIEFEFYDQGAPDPMGLMFMDVDGHQIASLSPRTDYSAYMANGQSSVMETIQINSPRNVARVVSEMKAGRWLTINYQRTSDERKEVAISLRGISAALRFMDRQLGK
ncbi:MAG: DUF1176 domain-containing protein [Rhizobiales bacterium]|nr:DUF1176 domain-containing protein [Hyphomicrobiales bacterium]